MNNFAISSDGIAEGLSRSASTLVSAGNSLEESIAMLAAGNKVQQDPEGLGNALKVLSMRIRGTKTELSEMGEETDGMIENTSKLRDKVMALTDVGDGGVDILTDSGAYKSTYQILLEIAEVWDRINEVDPKNQAALLEILAGKTRGSQVASILQNPADLKDAYKMALNSDGSAQQELDTYLDSIQGRIDLFTNELQTFWMNLINSNLVKGFVDAGTALLSILNKIMGAVDELAEGWGSLGVIIPGILIGIGTHIFKTKNDIKDMSGMIDFIGKGMSNFFKSGKDLYGTYVDNFGKSMNALSLQAQGATKSLLGSTKAGQMMKSSWAALTATIGTTGAVILGVAAALGVAALIYDAVTVSHKEYLKQLEKDTKNLNEIKKEQETVNDELEITRDRISELENKGPLSFTEQDELDRLRKYNEELERQEKILQAREKREKQKQIKTALGAIKTDQNLKENKINTSGSIAMGGGTGGSGTTYSGSMWEYYLNAAESAKKELDKADELYKQAVENEDENQDELKKALDKKQEIYDNANAKLDEYKTSWETNYGDVGYIEDATTEEEKAWNEHFRKIQEYINRQEWIAGNFGKSDILSSIFGQYASDTASTFKEEFEKGIKEGKNPSKVLQELFTGNREYASMLSGLASAYGITTNDIIGYFTQTGESAVKASEKTKAYITSLDKLATSIESYKAALQIVNEITHDGQAISEEYYNTLKEQLDDVTYGSQGFSDAIDTTNGYVIKNTTLLKNLVTQSKNANKATIQTAKAQAQLHYQELINQIRKSVIYLGAEAQAHEFVSRAVADNINVMRDQMETIDQTMQEYALLELSLSDAANAFDEYEKAKERDAKMTYDDSMLEMLKTIDEGLLKNETGTEAFEYAVKAIVPEQFWKDIDDVDEKIRSIHDYIDGDNVFSRFFYVDEDSGELDITTDNVREFVDLCVDSGLFDGSSKDFALNDSVEGIKDFAEGLGVTEAVALAMLTALEKVDAKWGNILTDVTLTPFERQVNATTQEIAELNKQYADGAIGLDDYIKKMAELDTKMDQHAEAAKTRLLGDDNGTEDTSDDKSGYIDVHKKVIEAQSNVDESTQKLIDAQKKYNEAIKGTDKEYIAECKEELEKTEEQLSGNLKILDETIEKRDELGKYPTQYEIEVAINDIDKEIEKFGTKFDGALKEYFTTDENGLWIVNTEVHADANLEDLEKKYPGIIEYIQLLNSKTELQTFADTSSAEESANKLKETVDGVIAAIEQNLITLDLDDAAVNNIVTQANRILSGIGNNLSVELDYTTPWGKNVSLGSVGFGVSAGSGETSGDANAFGSDGLKTAEYNSVVGELGRELVVDPNKGVYYTVGDNGTEMVDLPKGAIIYNHKQTEELLKNGKTSRGKLTGGLSFANGNAHGGISYGIPSYHPNRDAETSLDNFTRIDKDWDKATSTLLDAADGMEDAADEFKETVNWIEVLFTRIDNNLAEHEAYYETLTDTVGSIYSGAANAISITNAEIIAFGQQMQQAFNQTKVDLTKRPNVSGETMRQSGWNDADDDDYATVHTVTFTGSDFGLADEYGKDFAINVTPILPDGTVINGGEDGLWEYICGKLDEGKSLEDLDVFLGSYETIEKAVGEAEKLHEMQEEYYAMVKESSETSSSITAKESVLNSIYANLYSKASASLASADYYRKKAAEEMAGLPIDIQNRIKSGAIDITEFKFDKSTEGLTETQKKAVKQEQKAFEQYVEKIQNAIEYYDKISEYEQQYWTTITEIADKAKEHLDEVAQAYENEIGLTEHLNDMLEAHNDLLETREGFAAEAYYKAQISANKTMLSQYKAERKALQDVLDEEVRLGHVKIGDQQWFEMQQAIYDVDDAIIDMEASIEDLQNSINDLHWDRFDELINRFGYIEEEISNVIQLISHDPDGLIREELRDLTTDNWATGSGMATIGLYAQEMERAQYVANEYAQAIKQLERDRDKYNETEYLKKMNELISAQYENIEKYYDAKDAIIELNEARVDAIRDGIEKEIDAYQELIDKKKELLNREKDLHDFQNEISEKEKEVSDIRKQLAAMAGDTTAATTARRKKLEAELIDAQKSLEDSYYEHSMTSRNEALDKEFSSFEEEKNAEIAKWEEWLTETETVVSEALTYVKENTNLVYTELTELGNQYGLTLSDTLTTPWQNGQIAIDSYSTTFEEAKSAFTGMLDEIVLHWEDVTTAAEEAAAAQAKALQKEYDATANKVPSTGNNGNGGNTNNPPKPAAPVAPTAPKQPAATPTIKVGGKINAGSALIYEWAGDTTGEKQYYRNDPYYTVLKMQGDWVQVRHHKLSSGITGWFKKSQVKAYASGLDKASKDHWAIINELGSELQMVPGQRGNLEYVKYGTSILPHDVSAKLMQLALDPTSMFDDAKTSVKVPTIETKDFNYEFNFDSLLHVDNASNDSIPTLQKMIRSEFNSMMKQVNNSLKRA